MKPFNLFKELTLNKILFLLLIIVGCENKYINEDSYQLKIGEKVEIFYSTNSCCYYCVVNQSEMKHIELLGSKLMDSGPKDCDGCDYTSAFIFEAKTSGIDTIYLKRLSANQECDSSITGLKGYIIEVTE